uniref:Testis specific 13 n=1 Tax=Sphenodon punctatus TaxID=8508 RepID=A0A8D0G617_SPHPU
MKLKRFSLENEKAYTNWPNLKKYFVPLSDAEFQDRLDRRKRSMALMAKSSQFNQDKTTLIVTNNPLPVLISDQEKDTPMRFFSKDQFGTTVDSWGRFYLPMPKIQENQLMNSGPSFLVERVGKPLPFRFATEKDFKIEGQFSKAYMQRRLQRLYPHLQCQPGLEPLPQIESRSSRGSTSRWEPLTLSSLFKVKPTVNTPGENGFRYGKATQWVVKKSVVTNHK